MNDALQRDSFRLVADSIIEWDDAGRALSVLISRFAAAVGLHDAMFVVIDEASGSVVWRIREGEGVQARPPKEEFTDRTLSDFFGSETPEFDSERGHSLWTWEVDGKRGVAIPVRTGRSLVATFFGVGSGVGDEQLSADFARIAGPLVERLVEEGDRQDASEPGS